MCSPFLVANCSDVYVRTNTWSGLVLGGHSTYDYSLLIKRVDAFANALSELGVSDGDVVSIMLSNCPQAVIAFYAANKIGAIANMVHPLVSEGELVQSLELVGAKVLVTMDIFFDKATSAVNQLGQEDGAQSGAAPDGTACHLVVTKLTDELPIYARAILKIRSAQKGLPPRPVRASKNVSTYRSLMERGYVLHNRGMDVAQPDAETDLSKKSAVILFSGGTTGTPKGILLTNGCINAMAAQAKAALRIGPKDRMLTALPLFHGFGLTVCLHMPLCVGMECLLVPRLTTKEYTKVIVRGKCNCIAGVPTLLGRIADLPGGKNLDLSFIKEVISGGDSLPAEMRHKINTRLTECGCSIRVREGYGATESTAAVAVEPPEGSPEGSFGKMLLGNSFRIVDTQTGEDLPAGQDGELLLSGPTLMREYWNNPAETAANIETDSDGTRWLHTGDIARADEDGNLFYRGRIKRMIIASGYNIYPDQIERELNKFEQVAASCVIGVHDSYRLNRLKAFVVLQPGVASDDSTRKAINEALAKRVARYALPKEIEFREALPLTKVGKIAYRELEKEELERSV